MSWFNKVDRAHRNPPSLIELQRVNALSDERDELTEQVLELTRKVKELEQDRKIADEDIKHMVKMREERMELEFDKRVVAEEKKTATNIATVKDEYRDKMEIRLQTEVENIKEMYAQILERLPNVTARLKGNLDS